MSAEVRTAQHPRDRRPSRPPARPGAIVKIIIDDDRCPPGTGSNSQARAGNRQHGRHRAANVQSAGTRRCPILNVSLGRPMGRGDELVPGSSQSRVGLVRDFGNGHEP